VSNDAPSQTTGTVDYEAFEQSHEFQNLKYRYRRFVFPWSIAFMVWFLTYVLMSAYATEFMSTPVIGLINVGLLFGLLQFVTTFGITMLYVRYANKTLDPITSKLRDELEKEAAGGK